MYTNHREGRQMGIKIHNMYPNSNWFKWQFRKLEIETKTVMSLLADSDGDNQHYYRPNDVNQEKEKKSFPRP